MVSEIMGSELKMAAENGTYYISALGQSGKQDNIPTVTSTIF